MKPTGEPTYASAAAGERQGPASPPRAGRHPAWVPAVLVVVGTLAGVVAVSRYTALCVLLDGLAAVLVLGPAVLAGLWLVPWRPAAGLPLRWHLLLGATLGTGALSLLTLGLGIAGLLQRGLWVGVLFLLTVAGLVRLRALLHAHARRVPSAPVTESGDPDALGSSRYLWLLICPFLIIALLAATHAPGFLWREEGYGYDALEYHLQMPKEYRAAGRIGYAPHNVYANFPANVEMLYLLGMLLMDGDVDAGVAAHMIHLALAGLAVLAAWVVGRDVSPRAGLVSGVTLATTGWLPYLSGLAYVENGMLLYGIAAVGLVLRALRGERTAEAERPAVGRYRQLAVAGVLAGLACGCKYTAVAFVALPVVLAAALAGRGALRGRAVGVVVCGSAALLAFAPWLVKNAVLTGNPAFPLANGLFRAEPPGWGAEETARWQGGHALKPDERHLGTRLTALWTHLAGDRDQRFGPLVLLLGLVGVLARWFRGSRTLASPPGHMLSLSGAERAHLCTKEAPSLAQPSPLPLSQGERGPEATTPALSAAGEGVVPTLNTCPPGGARRAETASGWRVERADVALLLVLVVQLAVWLGATHLYARFAVVLLIPLVLLAGRAVAGSDRCRRTGDGGGVACTVGSGCFALVVVAVVLGAAWNLAFLGRLYAREGTGGAPASLMYEGRLSGTEYFKTINTDVPADARVLLVGEARAFYFRRPVDYFVVFNRQPFAEAVRAARAGTEVLDWLRREGYTHVLVNWWEIQRLQRTYGFPPEIDETLLRSLEILGLRLMEEYTLPLGATPYATLYEVPGSESGVTGTHLPHEQQGGQRNRNDARIGD
ncbi:MAG TPA: hypothetical protein PKK06_16120 [Phycisphaerae bacterium]|nr:hypothetical protein [Phycisphaerae bacterium]HNU46826.1 hypothetical protein [Phycisphaerae bacterium]